MNEHSIDLDALEKLARAASPGPWRVGFVNATCTLNHAHAWGECDYRVRGYAGATGVAVDVPVGASAHEGITVVGFEQAGPQDSAFIAAANPQTVLALIQMARDGYSRALKTIRDGMQMAAGSGVADVCPYGCTNKGWGAEPGCPVHPTALPLGSGR
jgi:hypothetical protein